MGIYYALEYDNKGAPPPYIERIIANLKHILGPQALVVQFRNNLLSQSKALFVEVTFALSILIMHSFNRIVLGATCWWTIDEV